MAWPFGDLLPGSFGALLVDPPWRFEVWSRETGLDRAPDKHYRTMTTEELAALPVGDLAADDAVLFIWITWPMLLSSLSVVKAWGFTYKTCAFDWTKADNTQIDFFQDELIAQMGLGHWTRANTEPCLLATKGSPKRLHADVRQAVVAPRREHSRKPEGIHARIERLVPGPYVELFSREERPGWSSWGNELGKFGKVVRVA